MSLDTKIILVIGITDDEYMIQFQLMTLEENHKAKWKVFRTPMDFFLSFFALLNFINVHRNILK